MPYNATYRKSRHLFHYLFTRAGILTYAPWGLAVFIVFFFFNNLFRINAAQLVMRIAVVAVPALYLLVRFKEFPFYGFLKRYEVFFLFLISVLLSFSFLYYKWLTGHAVQTIGGIIPTSDSAGYFHGALGLIEFGRLTPFPARRPLISCFYAILLFVTGQHLRWTLILSTLITGMSVSYCAKTIYAFFGFIAGTIYLFLALYFVGPYIGTFLSEVPGFIFANIALAFLLKGFSFNRFLYIASGFFLLAFALSIRAGAFFVIPALFIYWCWINRKNRSWRITGAVLLIVVSTFALALSPLLLLNIGPEDNFSYQGNFSYSLYGLASGGKGWPVIFSDHPELFDSGLSDGEISERIYSFALDKFKQNPALFFHAVTKTWSYIIRNPFDFSYQFDFPLHWNVFLVPFWMCWIGLFLPLNNRPKRILFLFLIIQTGVFLSAPLLVDGGRRIYAATLPVNCGILAAGTALTLSRLRRNGFFSERGTETVKPNRVDLVAALLLTMFTVLLPLAFRVLRSPPETPIRNNCAGTPIVFRYAKGSGLITSKIKSEAGADLLTVEEGSMLMNVQTLSENNFQYIYFPPDGIPAKTGTISACAERTGPKYEGRDIYRILSYNYIQNKEW